jgi:hypothetical protein
MNMTLIAVLLAASAAALDDHFARFVYSADLAQRMNAVYAAGQPPGADTPRFVVDEAQGRDLADARLVGAIQALIRAFPGCGNRQLQFAYAYAETSDTRIVALAQSDKHAPECPATAAVAVSKLNNTVTVRSFPDT